MVRETIFTETKPMQAIDPVSRVKSPIDRWERYSAPMGVMDKVEMIKAGSSYWATGPDSMSETQQDTWLVRIYTKTFSNKVAKDDSHGKRSKTSALLLTFQTKSKADAFAQAWNALIATINANG